MVVAFFYTVSRDSPKELGALDGYTHSSHTVLAVWNRTGFNDIPSMSSGMGKPARSKNVGVCMDNVFSQYLMQFATN